jgi:recombination protein RecA
VSQPDCGEDAFNIIETTVRSGLVDIIIVDSVSALTPKAEIEGETGDHHIGLQARMMSQGLRKLVGIVAKSNCTVIFINQTRLKIGVMWGNPETTSGGQALKFYASIRLRVTRKEMVGEKDFPIGIVQHVKAIKNKVAPPFREVDITLSFKKGYDVAKDLLTHCIDFDIIQKSGAMYKYDGESIGRGKKETLKELRSNRKLRKALKKEVRHCYANQETGES